MSYQQPMILFIGSSDQGTQLLNAVEPLGWWVYQPKTTTEALGMYVSFLPDVVVINAEAVPDIAENVCFHLAPIAAEPIVVLSDHDLWSDRVTHHLPANADLSEIIGCIAEITKANWQPEACH